MAASRVAIMLSLLLFSVACGSSTSDVQSTMAMDDQQVIPGTASAPGEKGGVDLTGPYELVPDWPDPNLCGEGYQPGATAGVWAESPDRIFVFQRGCLPAIEPASDVGSLRPLARNGAQYSLANDNEEFWPRWDHVFIILDREGNVTETWDRHSELFVRPHRIKVSPYDPERHVWLVDDGAHSVYKFTQAGDLVMTLGEFRVPGNDETHFNRPTDIAWLPDGTFFISDGYANTRVVKLDSDGNYLLEWGQPSEPGGRETRPGYFNTVHGIAIDNQRRVYAIDRANGRVQIFDENGEFIDLWNIRYPYYIYMSNDQHLWVSDGAINKVLKYDLNGRLLYSWGSYGNYPGGFWGLHQFSVDSENNLYTADVHVGRLQKLRPRPGAHPAQLVGQRVQAPPTTN